MGLISDSTGILRSPEAKSFIADFDKRLQSRITNMEGQEALALLLDIRENLLAEESAVNRSVCEIESLLNCLAHAGSSEEIDLLVTDFHQLAAEQFKSRASASTFHAHYSRFLELLISYATVTAITMLKNERIPLADKSWCVLVSGRLGRGEPGRRYQGKIIFIADDSEEFSIETFNRFAYQTLAIFEPLIAIGEKRTGSGRRQFWAGSLSEWQEVVDAGLSGGERSKAEKDLLADENLYADTFSVVADLRPLFGVMPLAEAVIMSSRMRVAAEFSGERFRQFARQTAALPVAIDFFGRIKTAKRGKHQGEFSLEELALKPLIASVRALAVFCGIMETATIARIKGILATGNLGVSHADRLLTAYQDFMKALIENELLESRVNEKIFFNPDILDESSRERFRLGLEDITTLQRIVYQHLVEGD